MKAFLSTCLLGALALAGFAAPAAADVSNEWISSRFPPSYQQRTTVTTSVATNRGKRTARVAATVDDETRPQRRNRTATPRVARITQSNSVGSQLSGIASYYWQPQPVASGGRFNPNALTAAHKTLPFGTRVRVTRQDNGRSVDVVINDRGPYIAGRIIDLSRRAAQDIGMTGQGLARVNVQVIGR
jgi:rare lipoprotein A (peptidoglycan hydrolase)